MKVFGEERRHFLQVRTNTKTSAITYEVNEWNWKDACRHGILNWPSEEENKTQMIETTTRDLMGVWVKTEKWEYTYVYIYYESESEFGSECWVYIAQLYIIESILLNIIEEPKAICI